MSCMRIWQVEEIRQLLAILIKSSLEHCTEILTIIASFFMDLGTSVLRAHLAVILGKVRSLLTTSIESSIEHCT